jgi:hypothetical protein
MSALDFFEPIVAIINKVIPDKAAAAVAAQSLQASLQTGELQQEMLQLTAVTTAQSDVDKTEAASASTFVAGARPFVMWICAFGLAYVSIIEPIARFVAQVGFKYAGMFPVIDTNLTMQVLLGLLGLGTMRSYDKVKGTDTKAIG